MALSFRVASRDSLRFLCPDEEDNSKVVQLPGRSACGDLLMRRRLGKADGREARRKI